ncbi:MAG: FAD-dependent oxidoreductase, partial [Oscillospiraceae bacterium]
GGVAGGASAAARLRRLDESAEIIVLERGEFISFANCGLPYYIGGEITDINSLTLQTPKSFKLRFNIDVRVLNEVTEIDPKSNIITVKDLSNDTTYLESYDKLILSPGANPVMPPISGINSDKVFTLRNIPDMVNIKNYIDKSNKKTAIVVGGGYIGVEMAENLKNAGLDVTIVELADHLIASLDLDMAADLHNHLEKRGIGVILNNAVTSVSDNGKSLNVILQHGEAEADMLIMAVGVRPESSLAKSCGIHLNQRGAIITDKNMKTNIHDIYAVGDAAEIENFITKQPGMIPLAGPANKQGRIAADNICEIHSEYSGTQGSAVLKIFDMTVATTGLNERSANDAGIIYDKTYIYSASHAVYYPGAQNMSIKVIWEKGTGKLLGAQIVGYGGVDKRMDVIATAIRFNAGVSELAELELCYAPPFGSAKDPVNMVGFVAENVISGKLNQFFWHDVENLPRDGSVTLLDVRTTTEVSRGQIDGFRHIPLDALRGRIDEIPKNKPVYIHCHSGLRSYIACRMLSGYGYECYNLAGGYRLYEAVLKQKKVADYICTECK